MRERQENRDAREGEKWAGAGTGIMLVSRCNRRIPVARVSDDHVYHGRLRKAHTSFRERESCNSIHVRM